MEELTGDDLLKLTMTRAVFPYFRKLLEENILYDGNDEVTVKVEEGPTGIITLWTSRKYGKR